MRIAVEATATAPGGGLSLLRHALPVLQAALPDARFDVYVGRALGSECFGGAATTIPVGPFRGWLHRIAWVQTAFARRAKRYDAVFAPGNFAPLGCADRTAVFVQNAHVLPHPGWSGEYRKPKRQLQRALARLSVARARALVFISNALRTWAAPYTLGRHDVPAVAHPGVTLPDVASPRADGPLSVLAVANLAPHKRLDRTIGIVAEVRRALGTPVRLRIAGGDVGNGAARRLTLLAAAHGLTSAVDLLGFVSGAELARLYAGSTCYLTNSALEAWPLPVVEALATGLPVAVPGREPFTEVCGDAGRYFSEDDDAAAVRCVRRLLDDADERAAARAAGLRRAAEFSWSAFGATLAAGLRTAAGG